MSFGFSNKFQLGCFIFLIHWHVSFENLSLPPEIRPKLSGNTKLNSAKIEHLKLPSYDGLAGKDHNFPHDSCDYGSIVTRMTLPSASNKPCIVVDSPEMGGETYVRSGKHLRPIFTVNCRILHLAEGLESSFQMRVLLNDVVVGTWNLSTRFRNLRDSHGAIPFRVNLPVFICGVYTLNLELVSVTSASLIASCRRAFGIVTHSPIKSDRPVRQRPFHRQQSKRTATRINENQSALPASPAEPRSEALGIESKPLRSSSPSWPLESCGNPESSGGEPLSEGLRKRPGSSINVGGPDVPWIGGPLGEPSRCDGESGGGPADGGWNLWQFGTGVPAGHDELANERRRTFAEGGSAEAIPAKRRSRAISRSPPPPLASAAGATLLAGAWWGAPLQVQGQTEGAGPAAGPFG